MKLDREEYIEQAYFFHALAERLAEGMATQDLLTSLEEEVLASTNLPKAIDFMSAELRLTGTFAPAMEKLSHYFAPFQAFLVREAEDEQGRFDFRTALVILERESQYRAEEATPQGMFFFHFETLCRNRLGYDGGLGAMMEDPIYDSAWREWFGVVRRQIGFIDIADLVFVRSDHYVETQKRRGAAVEEGATTLFGTKEGKIALALRRKDPLLFFSALQRQLGYPEVPRRVAEEPAVELLPRLLRQVERLESRMKLVEDEQRGGIDITKFYGGKPGPQGGAAGPE